MSMSNLKYRKSIIFAFALTIMLWASAFPMIKVALHAFKAIDLATLRLLIGALILFIFALVKKLPLPQVKDIPVILLLGFCGFTVYHTALGIGEYYVSAGVASLLVSTTPIFSALLAKVFLKERFSTKAWIGSLIAFIGVGFISLGDHHKLNVALIGVVLILLASFGESIYFAFQKYYLNKYGFIPFTIYTIIAGALCMVIFLPDSVHQIPHANVISIMAVIYLGIFPTVIPYICLAYTIDKVGVSDATISLYLTPAIALLLAFILVGEIPTLLALLGGIIILFGVTLTSLNTESH